MNKKQKIHAGMMQQTRVFIGRDGVTPRVKRQFSIAFVGELLSKYTLKDK